MTQAWPKGKMIEGRSGGSGRGTRRELWAPPDSGSAQPADRRFVSCTDARPEPFPAPPSHFLPFAASSAVAPACWSRGPPHPSARSARHSSPQNGGPKGKMIERNALILVILILCVFRDAESTRECSGVHGTSITIPLETRMDTG